VHIRLPTSTATEETLLRIQAILRRHAGSVPVIFCFIYPAGQLVFLEAHDHFSVVPTTELIDELEAILGEDTIYLKVDTEKFAAAATAPRRQWERKTSLPQKAVNWDSNRPEKA